MKLSNKKHLELVAKINEIHHNNSTTLDNFSVEEIVAFLEVSHQRFFNQLIPKIEQNFLLLIDYYQDNVSLKTLFNLFLKFEIDFKQHTQIEEQTLFPYVKNLYKASISNSITTALFIHFGQYSVNDFLNDHENSECYITEIIFLFQKQKEIQNHTIYNVLIKQLCQLDNEIKTHGWIEDNVLVNKVTLIENAIAGFVSNNSKNYE